MARSGATNHGDIRHAIFETRAIDSVLFRRTVSQLRRIAPEVCDVELDRERRLVCVVYRGGREPDVVGRVADLLDELGYDAKLRYDGKGRRRGSSKA
ncbi:MAG: hypothetical protein JXR37_15295 [Kiritimatiellae bacterium]|nr:hypothetical protein [Kiritimatiellia bacterium]